MRVVVVGGTGNVGTAILRRFVEETTSGQPLELVGVARRVPQPGAGHPYDRVSWRSVDIAADDARDQLTRVFAGADAVVHLAWGIAPSHRTHELERTNVAGSRAVIDAVRAAAVPHLLYASSLGTYAPRPDDDHAVDESWPATGITGSDYSEHKAQVERMLDEDEALPGGPIVTRMRAALVFQRAAASEVKRFFLGRLFPASLLRFPIPVVPIPSHWRLQVVHADDLADAYARALTRRAGGAFNVASDPVLRPDDIARLLRGRHVAVPERLLLEGARLSWHARLQPTSQGWVLMAARVPLLDSRRARTELDWTPLRDSRAAFRELLRGMTEGAGTGSPALQPSRSPRSAEREADRAV